MEFRDFIEQLSKHINKDLPFVAYQKPNQSIVKGFLQNDEKLYVVNDFSESGFVFAPFDNKKQTILLPFNVCQSIECEFHSSGMPNKTKKSFVSNDEEQHVNLVKKGIKAITLGTFQKVVLSRKETINLGLSSVFQLFVNMLNSYPTAFVYCWFHPKVGLWLGATPETLLKIENSRLFTMALAGTQEYKGSMDVSWGEKEREEQQIVTNFIVEQLKPLAENIELSEVRTVKAGNLLHLQTQISSAFKGNLKPIIEALHPTPAVCGLPKENAKAFILNNENYKRTFYAGFLGELNLKVTKIRNRNKRNVENNAYSSIRNQTDLYVNLRCMEVVNDTANIFVGGGITKDSDPKAEWLETVAKSSTMKKVLQ